MSEKQIYVLKLEGGKYYVGKSSKVDERYLQHLGSTGAEWTKLYKPIKLIATLDGNSTTENVETIKLMKEHGIDNVRGGTFCRISLEPQEKKFIEHEIRGFYDLCYNCGSCSHFVRDCPHPRNEKKSAPESVNEILLEIRENIRSIKKSIDEEKVKKEERNIAIVKSEEKKEKYEKDERDEKEDEKKDDEKLGCKLCGTPPFRDLWGLNRHLRSKKHLEKESGTKITCQINPERNVKTKQMRKNNVQTGKYRCEICEKNYSDSYVLKRHKRGVHGV